MEPILSDWIKEPVLRYLELLDRWSRTHALTSLEKEERFEELILDSAVLLPFLEPLPAGATVVDFGTGMGIPAVVLALGRPDLKVVALDKSHKKIAFVRQAAMELGLGNLHPLVGRAEQLPPMGARMGFAKAVGTLELLMAWWDRHGVAGAPFLALKGGEEPAPPGCVLAAHSYHLPTRGRRVVLELRRPVSG
jgi:16S rRNA (guanine527-N7)-methyltransferase